MSTRAFIALCVLWMIACGPEIRPQLYDGKLPPNLYVDLAGVFTLSPTGELLLALAQPCTVHVRPDWYEKTSLHCHRYLLDMIHVVARTPWGSRVPGAWIDEGHLVFRVDWSSTDLDLPDADLAALIARPWKISGTTWTPSANEAQHILTLLGMIDPAPDLASSGPPPSLEITRFEIEGGTLRAGGVSTLTVQITNRGPGTAYGVIATVHSGITSLHGRRARFGSITPGANQIRRLLLTLPDSETETDTMLVVAFDEGNGFSPSSINRRVPIAAPMSAPVLAVHCSIPGRSVDRLELDAGEILPMECRVHNSGTGAANVELEISLAGTTPATPPTQRVAPARYALFAVPITIPIALAIDSQVEITAVARDRHFARSASTQIIGVIRKPRLCIPDQLTQLQYREQLAGLRDALQRRTLTQVQFDRYDAELVSCLKMPRDVRPTLPAGPAPTSR